MTKINCTCDGCGRITTKDVKYYNRNIREGKKVYCSNKCYQKTRTLRKEYNCIFCGEVVVRAPGAVEESGNVFCSQSCAAKYNNPRRAKLDPDTICKCGKKKHKKSKLCSECRPVKRRKGLNNHLKSMTVGELRELYKDKSSLSLAGKMRGYSREVYKKSDKPKHCTNCGYSKHYEVCHIKAIKTFPDTATLAEVHALDNLVALCPNCHWEFDNGLLDL
jgi:hypothetical protein